MAKNHGRRRAKVKRKLERRKEREKDEQFGVIVTDKKGNKSLSLD